MFTQLVLHLRAFVGSDKVLYGETSVTKTANAKPERDNVEEIAEKILTFWEDHQHETIKVIRRYNMGTLAFSLNASGGEYLCYCSLVDTVEARMIDEILTDVKEQMSA